MRLLSLLILLIACHNISSGQAAPHDTYFTSSLGGLCNQTLLVFKNKTFATESGCEASSHSMFGTWTQIKDTLKFYPADREKLEIIKSIDSSITNDSFFTVKVIDKDGKNITKDIKIILKQNNKDICRLQWDTISCSSKCIKKESCVLVLRSLSYLLGKKLLVNPGKANNFTFTLNLSGDLLMSNHANWNNCSSFNLLKKKDHLLSISPVIVKYEDGKMVPVEFVKQKQ